MSLFELIRTVLEAIIVGQMGLFAFFLVSTGDKRPARLALAGLAAIFATVSIINALTSIGLAPWLRSLNLTLELLMGPTIYLFIQQIRSEPPVIGWLSIAHLFPLILGPILLLFVALVPVDAIVTAVHSCYLAAITNAVVRKKNLYKQKGLYRLVVLFACFFACLVLFRISISIESEFGRDFRMSASYIGVLVGMMALSGAIIFTALSNPKILSFSQAFTKYAGSTVSEGEIKLILARLDAILIEEKLFQNPNLNLDELAERVGAPAKHVSQAVNDKRGMSVPALINTVRTEYVAKELLDMSGKQSTITQIMHQAGFGSKSAFQREFQKRFGISPSQYRKQYIRHPN